VFTCVRKHYTWTAKIRALGVVSYYVCCVVFDVQDSFSTKRPLVVISDAFR